MTIRRVKREGTPRPPMPVKPGTKISRECPRCGAAPYVMCFQRRGGTYTGRPADMRDGTYDVKLKNCHPER